MKRWTLTDLRWKLAFWIWCPGAWCEEAIETWRGVNLEWPETETERLLAGLEQLPGFTEAELPFRYRLLRRVSDVAGWLSDLIYPDWSEDKRTALSYWKRADA